MNELDSDVMSGMLTKRGLLPSNDMDEADILIFNTCSVRDLAERKVMGKVGQLGRQTKKKHIIGISGCMANAKKTNLFKKLPNIDFVVGTNNIHDLNHILDSVIQRNEKPCLTDTVFSNELDYSLADRRDRYKAYVSIIRGCNKHCTYCVVPYTRGHEVSRPYQDIVEECKKLVDRGFLEIILIGQNVNSYGKEHPEWGMHFHDLLYQLDGISGLNRIRFLTSHPIDITPELMQAMRDLPSICEHLHFPIQSGSSRILRKMHRMYTKEEYLDKVKAIKVLVPNIALGTDIIVGFPTESDEEFEETAQVMREVRYSSAFIYTYSPRKLAPAFRWEDDVPNETKKERHQKLLNLHSDISSKILMEKIGQTFEILIERRSKDQKYLKGTTRCGSDVIVKGDDHLIGTLKMVTIHSLTKDTLYGNFVD